MTDGELLQQLAARAGVSERDAGAVLDTLAQIAREEASVGHAMPSIANCDAWALACGSRHTPSEQKVQDLIAAAARHPLGIAFLLEGQLDAVAATFRAHAFTVDAARDYLKTHAAAAGPGPEARPR